MPSRMAFARFLPRPPHTFTRALDELDQVSRQHEEIERRQFELEIKIESEIERTWGADDIQKAKMRAWYGAGEGTKRPLLSKGKKTSKRQREPRCEACGTTDISAADEPGTDPDKDYGCNRCGRIGSWEGAK